jgi:hypothetical protein
VLHPLPWMWPGPSEPDLYCMLHFFRQRHIARPSPRAQPADRHPQAPPNTPRPRPPLNHPSHPNTRYTPHTPHPPHTPHTPHTLHTPHTPHTPHPTRSAHLLTSLWRPSGRRPTAETHPHPHLAHPLLPPRIRSNVVPLAGRQGGQGGQQRADPPDPLRAAGCPPVAGRACGTPFLHSSPAPTHRQGPPACFQPPTQPQPHF